jgi:hypothetical protein
MLMINVEEKKNVYLAVAVGSLRSVYTIMGGYPHSKGKRVCMQTIENLMNNVAIKLPGVKDINMELFKSVILASQTVMDNIADTGKHKPIHILLNLASFCMEELPMKPKYWRKFMQLFDLYDKADVYEDVRAGERVFTRIESELEILTAQRMLDSNYGS